MEAAQDQKDKSAFEACKNTNLSIHSSPEDSITAVKHTIIY